MVVPISYRRQLAIECEQRLFEVPETGIELDEHQQDAMMEVTHALNTNINRMAIVHSCGSGKTLLEGNLAAASLAARKALNNLETDTDLILTTERALVQGIRTELQEKVGLDIGIWGNGEKQLDRPTIVASIQALQINKKKLHKVLPVNRIGMIIGDEADNFLTQTRMQLLDVFGNALRVGFTATPKWPDGRDISEVWGEKVHELKLKEGIERGINVPPMYYLYEVGIDESALKVAGDDYDKKTLSAGLKAAEIQKGVPEVWEQLVGIEKKKEYPTLIFVPSVDLVHATVETFQETYGGNIRAKGWTGESVTSKQMKEDIEAFNRGEIDVLVLCEMGGRGLNLPRAKCLIDAYPTLSPTKLEQRDGRVLRRIREESPLAEEGFTKNLALIAQIIPRANKFRAYTLLDLFDEWDDFEQGELLGKRNGFAGTQNKTGASLQQEVAEIRERVIAKKPLAHVELIRSLDVLKEIQMRNELPIANEDGFFEEGGVRYGTIRAWARELDTTWPTTKKRLKDIEGRKGKIKEGNVLDFYPENIVREKLADLLQDIPQANEDGFFEVDGVIYRTLRGWARKLEININRAKRHLNIILGRKGRGRTGVRNFYPENIVREKCADLLEDLPQAKEDGFFEIDGVRYGAIGTWGRELGVNYGTLKQKLSDTTGIKGKLKGHIYNFYPENTVREKCKEYLLGIPQADEDGFCRVDGVRYGTVELWTRELGVSGSAIKKRLEDTQEMKGKDNKGKIYNFYPENIVREKLADLLQDIPQANEDGFFEIDGVRYGAIGTWGRELGISDSAIKKRLEGAEKIKGKDKGGNVWDYYPENIVREKLADLLQDIPQANEDGFFEVDGVIYRTLRGWARKLEININRAKRHLNIILGRKGRGRTGVRNFYPENIVREKCADLLEDLPQAKEDGFFEIDGVRYGTIKTWEKELGVNYGTLKQKLSDTTGIKGKLKGHIYNFYPENTVREKCKEYLLGIPQADEDGFCRVDGVRYGTVELWTRELGVSGSAIKKRLEDTQEMKGKDNKGKIYNFYPENIVREKLADLLQDIPQANEDGFFEIDGVRYGAIGTWGRELGISDSAIKKRLEGAEKIKGKDKGGNVWDYYPENIVREKLADLLQDIPQANEDGFFEIDGVRYRTIKAWQRELEINYEGISKSLKGIQGRKGRTRRGICNFYPENIVLELCSDPLKKKDQS